MLPEIVISHSTAQMMRSYTLHEGFTTFGRYFDSEICMEDPSVSRDHGSFSLRFGVLMVEDHGSMNGIFVNGTRIKRKVLHSGDLLAIGPFEVFVKVGSKPPTC